MKYNELMRGIEKNVYKLLDAETILRILDKSNNLAGLEAFNKISVSILGDGTETDIRTEDEWHIFGRKVTNKNRPLYLVIPRTTRRYVDSISNNPIDITEFSMSEIDLAVAKNIIVIEESPKPSLIQKAYDIKDTQKVSNVEYANNHKFGVSELIYVVDTIVSTMNNVNENGLRELNKLKTQAKCNSDAVMRLIELMTSWVIANSNDEHVCNDNDILEMTKYSIATMFGVDNDVAVRGVLKRYGAGDMSELIEALKKCDSYSAVIYKICKYATNEGDSSNEYSSGIARKSEFIYNLMETFKIGKKVRGIVV